MLLVSVLRSTRRECSVGQGHSWSVTSAGGEAGREEGSGERADTGRRSHTN